MVDSTLLCAVQSLIHISGFIIFRATSKIPYNLLMCHEKLSSSLQTIRMKPEILLKRSMIMIDDHAHHWLYH